MSTDDYDRMERFDYKWNFKSEVDREGIVRKCKNEETSSSLGLSSKWNDKCKYM